VIEPTWPAPSNVHAFSTTRLGGKSSGPYRSLNLAAQVGDEPDAVAYNRQLLEQALPHAPAWLTQMHGTNVVHAEAVQSPVEADAAVTRKQGVVPVVLTADCLPVLFCDRAGTVVAAAHAGWRGLCNGVLENTLAAMECSTQDIYAWLGPAIGPTAFEVGEEVRAAFIAHDPQASLAFVEAEQTGKWLGNLYLLARQRLDKALVASITGGEYCTYTEAATFFSYRRDKVCGRMATLIWLGEP
jgi:YfiH family protein